MNRRFNHIGNAITGNYIFDHNFDINTIGFHTRHNTVQLTYFEGSLLLFNQVKQFAMRLIITSKVSELKIHL